MQKEKIHMAAIIDEHGGFEGIVIHGRPTWRISRGHLGWKDEEEQDIRVLVSNRVVEMSGRMDIEEAFDFLKLGRCR